MEIASIPSARRPRAGAAAVLAIALVCGLPRPARAAPPVWASGKVVDGSGDPVRGALVAVYDDRNHVVDYSRTDRNGEYALALPRGILHLPNRHGHGFIADVFGGLTRFVGATVGFVANPVRAGLRAITSSQAATFADPLTRGEIEAGGAVVDEALFAVSPHPKRPDSETNRKAPGALLVKVIAPDRLDMVGIDHIYWMEDETQPRGSRPRRVTAVWMDPVELDSLRSDGESHIQDTYLTFQGARLEPSVAEPGDTVRVYAEIPMPAEPSVDVVVVARNNRTGKIWELQPVGRSRFEGDIQVDRRFPIDDQVISLVAYAADQNHPGRRKDAERAILKAGLWDPRRPFAYDPQLVASRTRADLTLTVVRPRRRRRR